jgi:hypothetical protein
MRATRVLRRAVRSDQVLLDARIAGNSLTQTRTHENNLLYALSTRD